MGVDWLPCKTIPNANPVELKHAIARNHQSFLAHQGDSGLAVMLGFNEQNIGITRSRAMAEVKKPPHIEDLIQIHDSDVADEIQGASFRITSITNNLTFPAQWRIDAMRTLLPDELPAVINKWKRHYAQVCQGRHQRYIFEWFLFDSSVNIFFGFKSLHSLATSNENSAIDDLAQAILKLKVPAISGHPIWSKWCDAEDETIDRNFVERDERYQKLHRQLGILESFNHDWNEVSKKTMQPLNSYLVFDWLEFYSSHSNLALTEEFFAWVDPLIEQGFGLYRD